MARDIAEGFSAVTERTFKPMAPAEMDQLAFEIDRHLREIRGEQPSAEDLVNIKIRNRKIQRLTTALMLMRAFRAKARK